MKLHKASGRCLLAALSREDLSEYRLSFDDLNPENERTAAVIRTILQQAKHTFGFALPAPSTLCIDVLPEKDGGCVFLFTAQKKRFRVLRESRTICFYTKNVNAFLDILARLHVAPLCACAPKLYRCTDGFAALFSFKSTEDASRAQRLLSEFGTVMPAAAATAFLAEHGETIQFTPAP